MAFYAGSSSYGLNDGMSLETYNALQEEMEQMCGRLSSHSNNDSDNYYTNKITDEMKYIHELDDFSLPFAELLTDYEKEVLIHLAEDIRNYYKKKGNKGKLSVLFYCDDIPDDKINDFNWINVQKFLYRNNYNVLIKVRQKDKSLYFDVKFITDISLARLYKGTYCSNDWGPREHKWFNDEFNIGK